MPISVASVHPRSTSAEAEDRPAKKAKKELAPPPPVEVLPEGVDEAQLVREQMALPIEHVKTYEYELEYRNKLVLAPMVRSGSLPMRLMALKYGAGLVWSPEVIDRAIIGSTRVVDPVTGVIVYHKGQGAIFSTHPMEKPYLIFQIGTSDPELAVQAAKTVQQDVAGIDLNCGCPKPFSTHSGMGAALLSTPDILLNILRNLLDQIPLPISCKIRLLPTQPSTLYLVSRILRTGIRNLTVHCRTRNMRSTEPAIWDRLGDIVKLGKERGVPITCNGDGDGWSNWDHIREKTGADSVMIARSAERNPSMFCPTGPKDTVTEIIPRFLNLCHYIDNEWKNTRFLLNQFRPSTGPISKLTKQQRREASEAIGRSKTIEEVTEKLGIKLDSGKAVLDDIEAVIKARLEQEQKKETDVFEERHEAVEAGKAVDEPVTAEPEAQSDGFEVGVGQAQAEAAADQGADTEETGPARASEDSKAAAASTAA